GPFPQLDNRLPGEERSMPQVCAGGEHYPCHQPCNRRIAPSQVTGWYPGVHRHEPVDADHTRETKGHHPSRLEIPPGGGGGDPPKKSAPAAPQRRGARGPTPPAKRAEGPPA